MLYSSHIFMFPFRFDWNKSGFGSEFAFYKDNSIDKRVEKIDSFKGWEYKQFDLKQQTDLYSEYAYFYDYARDAIYNQSKEDAISYYFERELKDATYEIKILKTDKPYILDIKNISMRVFHTGIAILSIELENKKYDKFDEILNINDFGRRIYPQFISDGQTKSTKDSFLADSIKIKSKTLNAIENFCFKPSDDIAIGSHIMNLLGDSFSQDKKAQNEFYIQPILDDRMFVISWYGDERESEKLVNENYIKSDEWYKYVFVDNGEKTVFSPEMQTKLIKEATYDRWMNYKYNEKCSLTLYGVCRYSFVCISTIDFPLFHMKTMYFQMVTLLLATRASIIRFSDEIAAVATSKDIDRLQPLYEQYLTFYNRLYFKEVTHQDQGIELYDIARKQMRIDEHMEKLDNKFSKLFEYANLKANNETSNQMNKLTIMGAVFLPPSIMIALFSMGIFDYKQSIDALSIGLIAIFLSAVLSYLLLTLSSSKKFTLSKLWLWLVPFVIIGGFYFYSAKSLEYIGDKNRTKPKIIETTYKKVKNLIFKRKDSDVNKTK